MRARTLQTWIARRIGVRRRLERVCTGYLLFLMVITTKHSLEEAARFSGLHKSQCSKMLQAQSTVAVSTLESLSKQQAKHVAKALQKCKGLPWKIALILGACPRKKALKNNALELRGGDLKISHFPETAYLLEIRISSYF